MERPDLHRRLQSLDTEKHNVSPSLILPYTSPMQLSWSHSNTIAIAHCRAPKRNKSHAKGTDRGRTHLTNELPFVAGPSHFTRRNTMFCGPESSTTSPTHMYVLLILLCMLCYLMYCYVLYCYVILCDIVCNVNCSAMHCCMMYYAIYCDVMYCYVMH